MNVEVIGFIVGVIGAIWMKVSMRLLDREREQPEIKRLRPGLESPALRAFIQALSLILLGLGIETFARLFLNS